MTKTVDYSWTYVGAETIASSGYVGAERYLGYDGRCLTPSERDELLAEGLGIGLIWETAADRSLDGYWAGWNDAAAANSYADSLGAPHDVSIWYATDFHAQPSQIAGPIFDYYRGALDYGGRSVRVYGGAPVIDHMRDTLGLGDGWQAAAASWSNYVLSPNACLLQEVAQIWSGAADTNIVLCPDGEIDWLWGREGDWFSMATEEDLRRVTTEVVNNALSMMYTGPRLLRIPPDSRVFELVWVNGRRYKSHVPGEDAEHSLQWVDAVAGDPNRDQPRDITDPAYVAYFESLPWLDDDVATAAG